MCLCVCVRVCVSEWVRVKREREREKEGERNLFWWMMRNLTFRAKLIFSYVVAQTCKDTLAYSLCSHFSPLLRRFLTLHSTCWTPSHQAFCTRTYPLISTTTTDAGKQHALKKKVEGQFAWVVKWLNWSNDKHKLINNFYSPTSGLTLKLYTGFYNGYSYTK